ncbi:aaa family atpase, partial [Colletotrichum incanum]
LELAEILEKLLDGYTGLVLHKKPPQISPEHLYHAWSRLISRLEAENSKTDADGDLVNDIQAIREYLSHK